MVDEVEYKDASVDVSCRVPRYLKQQLETYYSNKEENLDLFDLDKAPDLSSLPLEGDPDVYFLTRILIF